MGTLPNWEFPLMSCSSPQSTFKKKPRDQGSIIKTKWNKTFGFNTSKVTTSLSGTFCKWEEGILIRGMWPHEYTAWQEGRTLKI